MKLRLPRVKNQRFINLMSAFVIIAVAVKLALRWLVAPAVQLTNLMRWLLVKNACSFIILMGAAFVTVWFKQQLGSTASILLFSVSTVLFCAGIAALKIHFDDVEDKRLVEKRQMPAAPKPTLFGADVPSSI